MSDENTSTETQQTETETPATSWDELFQGEDPAKVKKALEESRKWESRAKANHSAAQELEALRQSQMSEQEKAVEAARAEARAEALKGFGSRLVDAELRAAAAGRLDADRIDALLDGLDRSRFLTDDGDVDRPTLTAWVEKVTPAPGPRRPSGDIDQGVRTTSTASTAEQFAAAIEGQFTT